jgi:hypothetical protein
MTKMELINALFDDVQLEIQMLGAKGHQVVKELESLYLAQIKRNNKKESDKILKKIDEMWSPLREMQVEKNAARATKRITDQNIAVIKVESDYVDWRERIAGKRDEMDPILSPRGRNLEIYLHGVTPRGPEISTPRQDTYVSDNKLNNNHNNNPN